ncbi:MAG: isocitrate/isopropylmalate family dehydrogenase [Candidatus Nomurabacteria bacterium]|nr:isocitrate/isopropylmalate family dehydrogenase [Candidatus Nomurabacteria bacterium]
MTKIKEFKPIAFINADGGTGRAAKIVRETIFEEFPTVDIPMTVEERIRTNDNCIKEAVEALRKCGTGFKNSTASDHPKIKELGWKSANILMRPEVGAFGILRILQGPGRYKDICGVLRYAYGGFYDEKSCDIQIIKGRRVAVSTQHMDLDGLRPFAILANEIAKRQNLHIILSSKSTIAETQRLFRTEIEKVWEEFGLTRGEAYNKKGEIWTGNFHHELSDVLLAGLPIVTADGTPFANGKFLHVADNEVGDISTDIIDWQHGNRVMGSRVYCENPDGSQFIYEELPGGTADKMTTGEMIGDNFLNPIGIIFAMAASFEKVNPEQSEFFNEVRKYALNYIKIVPKKAERDTEKMINMIREKTCHLIK